MMDFLDFSGLYPALNDDEGENVRTMVEQWRNHMTRNKERMRHYEGKVPVQDLGISIPPALSFKLRGCSMMWARQAVNRIADASILRGFTFLQEPPAELYKVFNTVLDANELIDQYDELLPAQLVHGCSFWTVTQGGQSEPPCVVSSYDAEHATALYDYRRRRVKCGLTVVDVDDKHPEKPTAVNYFAGGGDVVELRRNRAGAWSATRKPCKSGRCMMVAMRNDPRKGRPFGQSVITPSIMTLEDEANREAVRMVMHAELYTAPTRWVMGADEDIFENGRWEAYLGSIFALPLNSAEESPSTGSYSVGDFTAHVSYIRQLANQFASEASIPIHSLLYTEANPASAEAIEASRNDLIERTRKVNRLNAKSLRDVALLCMSLIEEKPVTALDSGLFSCKADFESVAHVSTSAGADAACKIAAICPEFRYTREYWRLNGFSESAIDGILADLENVEEAR